ncbi:hypothetical protein E1J38_014855 [Seonamhaeicola sediminis]|uniref:Uncharacterized protein n=1 Tax=Seonamhaeicola sediminis TaxID=2528206 RepID=A0A562Y7C0_9FLAO|nr:hypothetical protein [Seonamhaeicola sediminis]TWO30334.1 hypothetical protein E1J38_014855 [Seonamhaeicola sediminis]
MKSHQKLWSLFFLIAPAVYIGMEHGFWKGIIALGIYAVLSMIVGWISVLSFPTKFMGIWAYLKGPIIAGIIIIGFNYFMS